MAFINVGNMIKRSCIGNDDDGGVANIEAMEPTANASYNCTRLCYRGNYTII